MDPGLRRDDILNYESHLYMCIVIDYLDPPLDWWDKESLWFRRSCVVTNMLLNINLFIIEWAIHRIAPTTELLYGVKHIMIYKI